MTLTRTQMHERAGSLSGEIKAAREAQSECRRALEDQERLVTIAAQAVERADARVEELLAERAQLAADMANAILQVGEAPLADEAAPALTFEFVARNFVDEPQGQPLETLGDPSKYCGKCGDRFCYGDCEPKLEAFPNAIFNGIDRAFDEATQP